MNNDINNSKVNIDVSTVNMSETCCDWLIESINQIMMNLSVVNVIIDRFIDADISIDRINKASTNIGIVAGDTTLIPISFSFENDIININIYSDLATDEKVANFKVKATYGETINLIHSDVASSENEEVSDIVNIVREVVTNFPEYSILEM